ncbi:ABC-F family ATP-binding cassette domain-containing protein [Streptomyces sp. NBC_01565]|uniref:ABC-F family ATP-binding cassette domain-containing protein n=1 Tax=unclassified Streptomyces TaxID=2593676 RepID=UPI00225688F6|nr:ABC-F family ATP-binding cassette domain-containing protein [Streptomyces sp. NBC_01565]MCX4546084.1 ATP-binding cassette domain-containing protein [Streptomyces sp. NBC_01565]
MRSRPSAVPATPLAAATPATAVSQLALTGVSKSYGDRLVLDQVSFTLRPGEKAAVIGENGSGKSTLMRLIAGVEQPDEGRITLAFPGGVGHLAQTLPLGPGRTVQDAVDAALHELRTLEAAIHAAESALAGAGPAELDAYGDLLTAYEAREGYAADARTDAALHGLGIGHIGRERTLGSLSGGEESRLALACVLGAAPELLLLDEPTNHLDDGAVTWLAERLRGHRGTVVVITHDRGFLERVATTVLEVDRDLRTVTRYGDGWAGYRTALAAARRGRELRHREYVDEVARTQRLVDAAGQRLAATGKDPRQGFGKHRRSHDAKLSGRVRAARRHLDGLLREPVAAPPEPLRFAARIEADGSPLPEDVPYVAELTGVRVDGRLSVPELAIEPGARLLVSGPNGAGKSTLLRVLAGDIAPDHGTVRCHTSVGYLPQEVAFDPARHPLLHGFAAGRPGDPDEYADELLSLGLFRPDDLHVPVASLSVGQRRRLELARLVTRPAGLLVLDEPTNHVSPALVEELEAALAAFPGAVVAVSHDSRFRSAFTAPHLDLHAGAPVTGGVRATRAWVVELKENDYR